MPPVQFGGGYEAEITGTLDGRVLQNVFWFIPRPDLDPPPTEQTIAFTLGNWYRVQIVPHLSNLYQMRDCKVTRFVGRSPPTATVPFTGAFGGVGGNCCPANVAYRVNFRVENPPPVAVEGVNSSRPFPRLSFNTTELT